MTNLMFNQDKANELFNSTNAFPINFDDAWQWLEYSEKRSAKVYLIANLEEGIDFVKNVPLGSLAVPRPSEQISLSIEGFKNWAMMSKTQTGKQVRKYFIECERIAKQKPVSSKQTLKEALLAQVALIEENERLEAENGFLNAQVDVLTEVVDELFDYSSIIRVAKHNNVNPDCFKWQKLKAASKVLGLDIKSAPCAIWKTKNLYSHDAWAFAYPEYNLPEPTSLMLG
jgi:phage anti-repressor protein